MTEQVAQPPHPPAHQAPDSHASGKAEEPHAGAEHHGHDNSPEAIRKEIRKYLYVFGGLAVLTIITVGIAQLHLPTWQAVILALAVATVKGTLVAAFFMHLLTERKLVFAVLLLTVFFFSVLMWGPWHHRTDAEREWPGYDAAPKQAPATTTDHGSGSGH